MNTDGEAPAVNQPEPLLEPSSSNQVARIWLQRVALLAILGGVFFLVYSSVFGIRWPETYLNNKASEVEARPTGMRANQPTNIGQPKNEELPDIKVILKSKKDLSEIVLFWGKKNDNVNIVQWKDYIFFRTTTIDTDEVKLTRYDLSTGKVDVVHEEAQARGLYFLQVIDDVLYYSVSDSISTSIFSLDEPTGVPQQISIPENSIGGSIELLAGKHWLIGEFGDSCGGVKEYALFDPAKKQATPFILTKLGCVEGDEFVGFDQQSAMIVARHVKSAKSDEPLAVTYTSVISIPFDAPDQPQELIAGDNMPDGIMGVAFSPETRQVALFGSALYIYDLQTTQIKQVAAIPTTWINARIFLWNENSLCIANDLYGIDMPLLETYEVNLENGSVGRDTDRCKLDARQRRYQEGPYIKNRRTPESVTRELNLPEGYQLETEIELPNSL